MEKGWRGEMDVISDDNSIVEMGGDVIKGGGRRGGIDEWVL